MDEYLAGPLRDFVGLFEKQGTPYALMGGIAVGAHGIPRPTHDIDFTIELQREELPGFFAAAEDLGYSIPQPYDAGWVDQVAGMPLVRVRHWVEGKAVDIDIFLAESTFQEAVLARRVCVDVDGAQAFVVSPEDLILLKLVAGRPRDIGDILDVFMAQGQLDTDYIRSWAVQLGVEGRLEDVLKQSRIE